MSFELDPSRGWRVVADRSEPAVAFAAAELEAALGPSGGEGIEIALSNAGGSGDGFGRRAGPERIELHGESPRALLFGAYRTLEDLGLRWPWPGKQRGRAYRHPFRTMPGSESGGHLAGGALARLDAPLHPSRVQGGVLAGEVDPALRAAPGVEAL
jgi:hypothetical protein